VDRRGDLRTDDCCWCDSGEVIPVKKLTSLLFGLLLVLSLVAGPAAATTGSTPTASTTDMVAPEECDVAAFVLNQCYTSWSVSTVNTDQEQALTQADLHATARAEYEKQAAILTIMKNYGQDTGTLASLEARHAIASAYENGSTAAAADAAAQAAIQEYYSIRQINALEAHSAQQAQLAYIGNVSNSDNVVDNYVYIQTTDTSYADDISSDGYIAESGLTGELVTHNYTLANGTEHEYKSAEVFVMAKHDGGSGSRTGKFGLRISDFEGSDNATYNLPDANGDETVTVNGLTNIRASYANTSYDVENGHPSQVVGDHNDWAATLSTFSEQSTEVESNYQAGLAQDLYDAMDSGEISPSDLRGAEGQVRYLSGGDEANVTQQRWKLALVSSLGIDNPDLANASTMVVHYDGYTDRRWNVSTDGDRQAILEGRVDKTYEGLLYSAETPSNGFDTGVTYDTSQLNGTQVIVTENGTEVPLYSGNLTIEAMYDQEGNQVDSTDWSQPEYSTYNSTRFIEYLNETKQQREVIVSIDDEPTANSGGGLSLPDFGLGLDGARSIFGGTVIMLVLAGAVVLVVIRG